MKEEDKLDWKDIDNIRQIMLQYNKEIKDDSEAFIPSDRAYAEEVLRRFELQKRLSVKGESCSKDRKEEGEAINAANHICSCGGKLRSDGYVMTSFPPMYPYRCEKCGKRYVYRTDGSRWEW